MTGGALTMVGTSPLILLNDLLVAASANLPSGAATLEPLNMFAPLPVGLSLLVASLLYFRFVGDRKLRGETTPTSPPRAPATSRAPTASTATCTSSR